MFVKVLNIFLKILNNMPCTKKAREHSPLQDKLMHIL